MGLCFIQFRLLIRNLYRIPDVRICSTSRKRSVTFRCFSETLFSFRVSNRLFVQYSLISRNASCSTATR